MTHTSRPRLPPVECLQAALTAQRTGSFSAAAALLGVTHAAISRRVAGAEAWAGVALFERHGRGVRPTGPGQRILTRIAASFAEIEALVDGAHRPSPRDIVRLAVTPSFARLWLLPRLALLEDGDLRLEVMAEQRNADLAQGEADLAVRYGRGGWGLGAEAPLFDERLVPVAAEPWSEAPGPDPLRRPVLHVGDTALWRAWARDRGLGFRNKAADRTFGDYGLAIEAARLGWGVAFWNPALHDLPAGLAALPEAAFQPALRHHLLTPRRGGSAAVARLAERLARFARTDLPSGVPRSA